jgi:2-methylcitrate dehydratase PrpD
MKKVNAHIDPDIENMGVAYRHASRVKVTTTMGKVYSQEILDRRGSPENPLSKSDVQFKFRNVVSGILRESQIDEMIELVDRMEDLPDLDRLMVLLSCE